MQFRTQMGIYLAERGWVPDRVLRLAIRRLCRRRLQRVSARFLAEKVTADRRENVADQPVAVETEVANQQHYELPEAFFGELLGTYRKYSCCYWKEGETDLDRAEREALQQTCDHAQIEDGMTVLDLGCGWGSMTCWLAEQYPGCSVQAVSNSHSQRNYIEQVVAARGWQDRVKVLTADVNVFDPETRFDRIVSVEMLEHVQHHEPLFRRMKSWLNPTGKLLAHVFTHRRYSYPFETEGADNWMGRYFFTGGMMPSQDLLPAAATGFVLERDWTWNGRHYQRTADAWLSKMDAGSRNVRGILDTHYQDQGAIWWHRWRMFLLAVSELFGFDDGNQWQVNHYRFALPG